MRPIIMAGERQIPFDVVREKALALSEKKRRESAELFSEISRDVFTSQEGSAIRGKSLKAIALSNAAIFLDSNFVEGYEYLLNNRLKELDEQKAALDNQYEEIDKQRKSVIEETEAIIVTLLEEKRINPAELGFAVDAAEERLVEVEDADSDKDQQGQEIDEEEKAKALARIKRKMGDLDAFKTGDSEIDERLNRELTDLEGIGWALGYYFAKKFRIEGRVSIGEFLTRDLEELLIVNSWGSSRANKVIEQIYEMGIVPDEKWDYEEMVDKFLETEGFIFSKDAKNAFMNAIVEASNLGHEVIDTKHIILGILKDQEPQIIFPDSEKTFSKKEIQDEIYYLLGREASATDIETLEVSATAFRALLKSNQYQGREQKDDIGLMQLVEAIVTEDSGLTEKVYAYLRDFKV